MCSAQLKVIISFHFFPQAQKHLRRKSEGHFIKDKRLSRFSNYNELSLLQGKQFSNPQNPQNYETTPVSL